MTTFHGRKRHCGVVALALMAMVLTVSSLYIVTRFRTAGANHTSSETRAALEQARLALLGYAAGYPDRINAKFGPGYLPCPARNERGVAGPACAASSGSTRGRFPWHTLRTNDIRDGSGETLWYALSQSHRYNPKLEPLNSDTVTQIQVDGEAAVAVLIAPGAPLSAQRGRRSNPLEASQFLESLNGDSDITRFTRSDGSGRAFNDQIAVITRGDLMNVVEPRVLGELEQRLRDYAVSHSGRYPWMTNQRPDGSAPNLGTPGTREGWLPFHYFDSLESASNPDRFSSDIALTWDLVDVNSRIEDESGLIPPACLTQFPCTLLAGPDLAVALAGTALCYWWSPQADIPPREIARCDLEQLSTNGEWTFHYLVSFAIADGDGDLEIRGPSDSRVRTRRVVTNTVGPIARWPGMYIRFALRVSRADGRIATAEVTIDDRSQGIFAVDGIAYALDVNHGELPAWFTRNAWHEQVYVAWAEPDCVPRATCLAVEVVRVDAMPLLHNDVRALVIAAGSPLANAPARGPSATVTAWFERNNQRLDDRTGPFLMAPVDAGFNDRLRIIEPLP